MPCCQMNLTDSIHVNAKHSIQLRGALQRQLCFALLTAHMSHSRHSTHTIYQYS